MGLLSRTGDFFYALRFLRLLTTPWEKTGAYRMGIVDENGKKLKKPETSEEKSVYNVFHKLVFNIKRLLNKIPFGKSTIASYLAALYLIKEHTGLSDSKIKKIIKETTGCDMNDYLPELNEWYLDESGEIEIGKYTLVHDIALPKTGEILAKANSLIEITEQKQIGSILGHAVFKGKHLKTQQTVYVTQEDLTR
jgi:hypothetical protein